MVLFIQLRGGHRRCSPRVAEYRIERPKIKIVGKKPCNPSHVMHLAIEPDTLTSVRAESLSPRGTRSGGPSAVERLRGRIATVVA